jgi:DNA-directed RNA polymerase subunit RPC12/RpoP
MASKDEAPLALSCPRCLASLEVPALLAGKQCRCPHCQFVVDVPKTAATAQRSAEAAPALDDRPPPAGEATYVPVVCPTCHTRMYGTIEQVGQKLSCPDCGTPSVVPPPTAVARVTAAPEVVDLYPLAAETAPATGAPRPPEQSYVALLCYRCGTRLTATLDQVGDTLLCPDCGMANVVPPPPQKKRKAEKEAVASYGLAKIDEQESPVATEEPEAMRKARRKPRSERPVLPPRPFISGTFTFPFYPSTLARVVGLTVWSLVGEKLLSTAIELGGDDPHTWLGSALLGALTLFVVLSWFLFAAACGLAVLRETANGCARILDWPGLAFFDWFLDPFYLLNAICISVLPAALVVGSLSLAGRSADLVPLVSLFLFFPPVLLSMLETESPLLPLSGPLLRSLRTAWLGWLGFYVAAVALLAAAVNVVLAVRPAGTFWQIIVASPVTVIVWFVYFRLLGRLAWYCAEHGEPEAEAEEDEEAEGEDEAETDEWAGLDKEDAAEV